MFDPASDADFAASRYGRRGQDPGTGKFRSRSRAPPRRDMATPDRSQEFLGFVENSPDLIFRCDRKLHLTYVNPAVARAFRLPAEDILGTSMSSSALRGLGAEANDPELAKFEERLEAVFGTGDSAEFEFTWPTAEGLRT